MEHSPELCDIGHRGDVCVKDDGRLQIGRKSLGEEKLHQTINHRVMFVGDSGNFRLELICIVEVYSHSRHHPGLEERCHNLLSDEVGDEVEMQGVLPVKQDSLHQGDNIQADVVSDTDSSNVDCLALLRDWLLPTLGAVACHDASSEVLAVASALLFDSQILLA